MAYRNEAVPGVDKFYPLNKPQIGASFSPEIYPQNHVLPKLFEPLTIKGVTFNNRIFVSPMCQYSSDNGHATDWHLVHIGGFATRGAGAVTMEATAYVPEGRISPEDAGIWTDSHIAPLERIVKFAHSQGTKIGIQLAHAGRKASTQAPWVHGDIAHTWHASSHVSSVEEGGWPENVYGPSNIPFSDKYPVPKPLTREDMTLLEENLVAAIVRCKKAGFDFIELHFAHGYLAHTFLSPLSNTRADEFGGQPLENRMRFPLQIVRRTRKEWSDKPLFVRISACDWAEGPEKGADGLWKQWGITQSTTFVRELKQMGVDLIDVSSGGLWEQQKISVGPGYQVPFAEQLKKNVPEILIGAVGMITVPKQAESYLQDRKADVVSLARELIRDPHWPMTAATELGVAIKPANQYERAWVQMLTPHEQTADGRGKEQGM